MSKKLRRYLSSFLRHWRHSLFIFIGIHNYGLNRNVQHTAVLTVIIYLTGLVWRWRKWVHDMGWIPVWDEEAAAVFHRVYSWMLLASDDRRVLKSIKQIYCKTIFLQLIPPSLQKGNKRWRRERCVLTYRFCVVINTVFSLKVKGLVSFPPQAL